MKTVFITGASSGIGKAAARYFLEKGWNVAATMRSPDKEKELSGDRNCICPALDVTDSKSIKKAVSEAVKRFGRIDALVNNAGFSLIGPFETTEDKDIQRQFDTNVFGLMNVTREILPLFREQKAGSIINVASIGGRVGIPLYSLYNGTKFAVEGFSESLQWELEPYNIRVKIIEPGVIKTDFYGRSMTRTVKDKSPYADFTAGVLGTLMNFEKSGIGPDKVAKAIYRAANSGSRKMRYSVGPDAKSLLTFLKILPFGALRRLLKSYLKVPR